MIFLSVIIPAYNEEKRLPKTLKKVRDYLDHQNYTYEVYVVDDGSKDRTWEVTKDLIKDWSNFKVISYTPNRGKGFAVKTGMLTAKGEWRLLMDADSSTDISEIEELFNFANLKSQSPNSKQIPNTNDQKYEIIIGSRYLKKDSIKIKQPLGRRIMSRMGNWLIRIVLGIRAVDTQCGFKLFSAKAANEIFPLQTIDRWGFDMEILAIARKYGYEIKEVAVDWYDAEGSQVKKGVVWKTLRELMIIKWNLLTGKYS